LGCRFADRCVAVSEACREKDLELSAIHQTGGRTHSVRCTLFSENLGTGNTLAQSPIVQAFNLDTVLATNDGVSPALSVSEGHAHLDSLTTSSNQAQVNERQNTGVLLEIKNLSVRFPIRGGLLRRTKNHVLAVDDVSFKIPLGRTLALVGESGCGKTTIGKAVLQLLRGRAEIDGQALINGQNLFDLKGAALREARRHIQIIFQDPYSSLNPRMRVSDILEEGMLHLQSSLSREQRASEIRQLMDQVGLRSDALNRYPHEFSGGQRQRIAIARALAVRPKIIICDEPTSALDVSVQAQILNLLRDLQDATGVSYLFITHNIGVVEYVADEVAVMQNGKILERGLASDILSKPQHQYTRTLLAAVPRVRTTA
jgi:peptide/nickel transport system ATP-binding protein